MTDAWDVDLDAYAERIETYDGNDGPLMVNLRTQPPSDIWPLTPALCFKPVRGGTEPVRRGFAELVCVKLAKLVGVPIPAMRLVTHPEWRVGLISRYIDGADRADPADYPDAVNASALPTILAFEHWVRNMDNPHFIAEPTDKGPRLWTIDHNHTLDILTDGGPDPTLDPGAWPPVSGIESVEDARPGIDPIQGVTDAEINQTVKSAAEAFQSAGCFQGFTDALGYDTAELQDGVTALLRERRDHIDAIMADAFG